MKRAGRWLAVFGVVGGCTPGASDAGPRQREASPPSAASVAPSQRAAARPVPTTSAAASDFDAGAGASAWQVVCLAGLNAARGPASRIHPEFARAGMNSERAGIRGETVTMYMFPPAWKTPGFHLMISRSPRTGKNPNEHAWRRHAEVLGSSYHATISREERDTRASIIFDGWTSPQVDALEPILTAAADGCFEAR